MPAVSLKSILLVDDEPLYLTAVQDILEYEGYVVEILDHPKKALEKDLSQFVAVISDLNMPEMNGLELQKEILKKHPQLRVFVWSALPPLDGSCLEKGSKAIKKIVSALAE